MSIIATQPGKTQLILDNPVMPVAGTFGYGNAYQDMVNIKKLGALVTNPVTYYPRHPAKGVRVVPLDSGVLVHTGMPNSGTAKVIKRHRSTWEGLGIPVILHIADNNPTDLRKSIEIVDTVDSITALEIGLQDDITWEEASHLTETAVRHTEKPVIVRLPMYSAYEVAEGVASAGAGAVVVAASPRGTARDPISGQLVNGRIYSPLMKTMCLNLVETLVKKLDVPVIGSGGIHSQQDARDFIEAGAVSVQVGSVGWVLPRMIEIIARDLGGLVLTKKQGALGDEWFTGIGQTDVLKREDLYDDEKKV